jgi:hypothetical protein
MVVITDVQIDRIRRATAMMVGADRRNFQAALLEQLLSRHDDEAGDATLSRALLELQRRHLRVAAR